MRKIKAKHFFNSSFKEFSLHDNVRSIPSITDGMKQSQRKAVYGMLKRGENAPELQVERLAGQISSCLVGNTEVILEDGTSITLEQLAKLFECEVKPNLKVCSSDEHGDVGFYQIENAFQTKHATELLCIEDEHGKIIELTPDHQVMTNNGWKRADELTLDDMLISY